MNILSIALFGCLGVLFRFFLGAWIGRVFPAPFPYGTFTINLMGAFLIGVLYVLGVERTAIPADLRLGLMVGFLGGFTTFSAYCLELVKLLEESKLAYAVLYCSLSNVGGLLATFGGLLLTRFLIRHVS